MRKQNYQEVEFLEKHWNNEKNNMDLIDAKLETNFRYWWFCQDFDHSFEKTIRSMEKNQSCMVCIGKQLWPGFNDFETAGIEYMHEWDYDKNSIKPNEVLKSSKTLIWWKCKLNHSWQTNTQDKIRNRGGCPYCKNMQLLKGFNDIESQYPKLVQEWDFEKNDLTPSEVKCSTTKLFSWICRNNHQWKESPFNRTNQARNWGCPYCANKRVLKGYNDLTTTHPHMIEQWDFEKNEISPSEVTYGSNKIVWWLCKKLNHSWQVSVNEKTKYDCAYCAGIKTLSGFNDLETKAPHLLKYWDYEKNDIKPNQIAVNSLIKVWWKCDKNHSYDMTPGGKYNENYGCPICSNMRILKGYNDLVTIYPNIAEQWHPTKNGKLKPDEVAYGSGVKVWWVCEKDKKNHVWKTAVVKRTRENQNCPRCCHVGTSNGEKDLFNFIESLLNDDEIILSNVRSVIAPYELDVYVPHLNIALEYNGTYWHSDEVIQNNHGMSSDEYHLMKTELCNDLGIKLLHIAEEDWTNNNSELKNLVESFVNSSKID